MSEGPAAGPGRITALRFQKRNTERVNVFVEGRFALAVPAVEAARLKVGQMLDAGEMDRLRRAGRRQLAFDRAVRFLSYRPRSVQEVRRYLLDKGVDEFEAGEIIQRLMDLGYLDDREFARWWVENRSEFSPRGSYALRRELRRKGVEDEVIAAALDQCAPDAGEKIEAVARKRARRLRGEDALAFRRKLGAFLLRRGFSYESVAPVVEQLWSEREAEQGDEGDGE